MVRTRGWEADAGRQAERSDKLNERGCGVNGSRVQSERDCVVEAIACALDANVPCVVLRQESSALIMCCVDCEEIVAVELRNAATCHFGPVLTIRRSLGR